MEKQYLPDEIRGERVTLKKQKVELAQKMFDYIQQDKQRLSVFLPWPKYINSVQDEVDFINRCNEQWKNYESAPYGIFRNTDNEYLGNITPFGFSWSNHYCEIGYWILGKFEKQGYVSESVSLLEKILFDIGFNRIVIQCDPSNERSRSIPLRLGYKLDGVLREVNFFDGNYKSDEVYSKIRADLRSSK